MRDFFSLDGSFNKYGSLLADTIILSLLWLFFSLPIVTIGASTSAMYYVATRRISEREGYMTSDFWSAFKSNFVRSTVLWLMVLVLAIVLVFNVSVAGALGNMARIVVPAQIVIAIQLIVICTFMFPMTSRFDMTIKHTIKSSFFMANRHLFTSIICVALLLLLVIVAIYFLPPLLLLIPGIYAMISSMLIMRIFKKYRPEMDKDPVLEIQEIEAQKAEERRLSGISMMDTEPQDEPQNSENEQEH